MKSFIFASFGLPLKFSFFVGEQTRIYLCIKKDTGEEARGYCSDQGAPGVQKQPCNRHCIIKYNNNYFFYT